MNSVYLYHVTGEYLNIHRLKDIKVKGLDRAMVLGSFQ